MAIVLTAALLSLCGAARAQGTNSGEIKEALMAPNVDPGWEVATVRPSDPDEQEQSFSVRGRHVLIKRQSVETMLMVGYGLQKSQIANAPEWVKTESFDVDGFPDAAGQPSVQQFQSMVRKLLVERFGLKMHKEQREMAAYALTIAKGGMKLTPTSSDPSALPEQEVQGGNADRQLKFTNVSMQDFSLMLLYEVDKPLVDRTGLSGRYDFRVTFTKDESSVPAGGSSSPGLFTAMQEQLGLKLEPVKTAVDVLVVDRIQKPTAN